MTLFSPKQSKTAPALVGLALLVFSTAAPYAVAASAPPVEPAAAVASEAALPQDQAEPAQGEEEHAESHRRYAGQCELEELEQGTGKLGATAAAPAKREEPRGHDGG